MGPTDDVVSKAELTSMKQLATAALAIRSAYTAVTDTTVRDLIQMVNNLPDLTFVKPVHKKGYESHHAVYTALAHSLMRSLYLTNTDFYQ